MKSYKPKHYNSLSPYLIVDDAQKLANLLKDIFGATELRRYEREDGTIVHLELKLDDTVLMMSNSTQAYKANKTILHMYVPDVVKTFNIAIDKGCEPIEAPTNKGDDPDKRGSFYDSAGNYWSISTQL